MNKQNAIFANDVAEMEKVIDQIINQTPKSISKRKAVKILNKYKKLVPLDSNSGYMKVYDEDGSGCGHGFEVTYENVDAKSMIESSKNGDEYGYRGVLRTTYAFLVGERRSLVIRKYTF